MEWSERLQWLQGDLIRPYVFVRKENREGRPGEAHTCEWFPHQPIVFDPLNMESVSFGNQILDIETQAFTESDMAMPRWVFYDCAVMPGFVAGFAHRTKELRPSIRDSLKVDPQSEWTPLSLFIVIPAIAPQEWTAHNLSSVNFLLPKENRFYGLGFLTKAFALWYANIEICCGMTQWRSPAIRLHSHYGEFEILTAYTPLHSYAETLTYRLTVDTSYWSSFFTKDSIEGFHKRFQETDLIVNPKKKSELIDLQKRIENEEGPYYFNPHEIRKQKLDAPIKLYRRS